MKTRILLSAFLGAVLVAGCKWDGDGSSPRATPTTTELATGQIADRTADGALPIDLNGLSISDADTDEASSPISI